MKLPRFSRGLPVRFSRIGVRLLAFNLLLVFLPIAGILYLDVYEQELLQAQERGMVQQARLLAAALGGESEVGGTEAIELLRRLERRSDSRVRVYDATGRLLADSAAVFGEASVARADAVDRDEADRRVRARLLYRLGAWLAQARVAVTDLARSVLTPAAEDSYTARVPAATPPEVHHALRGRYGAATRPTPGQRSLTLNSAVPIRSGEAVTGAVLVSQSTYRILGALYAVRLRVFEIVVASLVAAALLSLMFAKTIVYPLARLRQAAAARADSPSAGPVAFPGAGRRDEIGDLARALEDLTRRLDAHVRLLESFAADVSHEFRNPLTAIRAAAEMLAEAPTEADRRRFLTMLTRDVDRLERLVSGVRELARIDAQLAHEAFEAVDIGGLLEDLAAGLRLSTGAAFEIDVRAACRVMGSRERLAQVFENVLANACSFTPPGRPVTIVMDAAGADGTCRVTVSDAGPGIPIEHAGRVFDRFFTYRPDQSPGRREHAGLGLSIARAIVEGYGGSIHAANRPEGGAMFEIRLPAVAAGAAAAPRRTLETSGLSHA